MAFTKLTAEERETNLTYNESDGFWMITTDVQKHMTRLERLGYEPVKTVYYPDGSVETKEYKLPAWGVSFRKPEKITRTMTEEQKEAARESIKRATAARIANKG